jgi:dephospho-CoA kinase
MRAVICLSCGVASGKTTVAQALAKHLPNAAVRSFGDVVRHRARSQGKPLDRATLQAVGLALVDAGWQSFVDALLDDAPQSISVLIVEGIRHFEAVEELRRRHLSDTFLTVYLKVEAQVQEKRLKERGESLASRGHAVESFLPQVEAGTDLVINGALPPSEITAKTPASLRGVNY